eukprot:6293309-Ditylum_brightwellii.AAC.1
MSTYSMEEVRSKFPYKTLSRCNREPNYEYIHDVMMAVYANAAAVPTALGGGAHGHIGLVMKDVLYGTLSGGTAYTTPPEPVQGQLPAGASLAGRKEHERLYCADK